MNQKEELERRIDDLRKRHKRLVLAEEAKKGPPLCRCGCGEKVNWRKGVGWASCIRGHGNKKYVKKGEPPLCACGCGEKVTWVRGKGWNTYRVGHVRKNKPMAQEHKDNISASLRQIHKGKRNRDLEEMPGLGVYATYEYREARAKAIKGRDCLLCGSTENIHAHHVVPGDDTTLIPVCARCHPTLHATQGAKGQQPSYGEKAPLCACGCGRPVKWKRVRGWATYCRGHGNVKIPAGTKDQKAPLCACGCGERTKFRFGVGWHKFKQGHGQRVYGHYSRKAKQ